MPLLALSTEECDFLARLLKDTDYAAYSDPDREAMRRLSAYFAGHAAMAREPFKPHEGGET